MNPTKKIYTRHGASRAGDDYQDLWGAEILIKFLEHPERYECVKFEDNDAGYLDDIRALRKDGSYVFRQIKFTVDPEEPKYELSWKYLLEQKAGKKGSRLSWLQKWSKTFFSLKKQYKIYEASLYTNRKSSLEIENLLSVEGEITFDKIKDEPLLTKIKEQLCGEERAKEFFKEFRFYVDKPNPETLEERLFKRFTTLNGNYQGWHNLLSEIRRWVKLKNYPDPDGCITYGILKIAVQWHQLKRLPQDFEIPKDYVLPSKQFHKEFLDNILNGTEKCLVLTGSPGVGKSTYLSFLVDILKKKNIPVIRHHYFLSLSDRSGDRYDHRKVAESIMNQIEKNYGQALGSLIKRNPSPDDICNWLDECGHFYSNQNIPFIIIIDGLDHVWRERKRIDELNLLFEKLLPLTNNLVLIIGTQKVDNKYLPSRLLTYAPKNKWITLPLLGLIAIKYWLKRHNDVLDLPKEKNSQEYLINQSAKAFQKISHGHPLHLKYSMDYLYKNNLQIREHNIISLPVCPNGDIEKYYNQLWGTLQEKDEVVPILWTAGVGF